VLKIINFSYADTISNNYFVILGFAALLMYLRLWSSWSRWFLTLAFACGCIVALYVYDCTCNISQAYAYNIEFNYLVQVALYLVVTSVGVGCMYWAHPSEMYYVVPMVCVIFVVNFVRRRHIIHSVLMTGSILMYVGG
jgi:membrane-associated HD superfamily phosphohydrolase